QLFKQCAFKVCQLAQQAVEGGDDGVGEGQDVADGAVQQRQRLVEQIDVLALEQFQYALEHRHEIAGREVGELGNVIGVRNVVERRENVDRAAAGEGQIDRRIGR